MLQPLLDRSEILREAISIWSSGGWAMIALVINAMLLYTIGINLWLGMRRRAFRGVQESTWRRWLGEPGARTGRLGELITFVMDAGDLDELGVRFGELRASEIAPFTRDLKFMRRAVSTAPLLGLLGTVTGMLSTFHALAMGAGGDKTMDMVASGISEALITTETGLIIALPGLFLQYHLARGREQYESFLAHLESACAQFLFRRHDAAGRSEP